MEIALDFVGSLSLLLLVLSPGLVALGGAVREHRITRQLRAAERAGLQRPEAHSAAQPAPTTPAPTTPAAKTAPSLACSTTPRVC